MLAGSSFADRALGAQTWLTGGHSKVVVGDVDGSPDADAGTDVGTGSDSGSGTGLDTGADVAGAGTADAGTAGAGAGKSGMWPWRWEDGRERSGCKKKCFVLPINDGDDSRGCSDGRDKRLAECSHPSLSAIVVSPTSALASSAVPGILDASSSSCTTTLCESSGPNVALEMCVLSLVAQSIHRSQNDRIDSAPWRSSFSFIPLLHSSDAMDVGVLVQCPLCVIELACLTSHQFQSRCVQCLWGSFERNDLPLDGAMIGHSPPPLPEVCIHLSSCPCQLGLSLHCGCGTIRPRPS